MKKISFISIIFGIFIANFAKAQYPKFKDIALNKRNGGVGLLGEDGINYHCGFHYYSLDKAVTQNNVPIERFSTQEDGKAWVYTKKLGMLSGGNPVAPHLRQANLPYPHTTCVFSDRERGHALWYIDQAGNIKPVNNADAAFTPPPKKTQLFKVYNNEFYMVDEVNDLFFWQPGMAKWAKQGDIKAKYLTQDHGISTPLWFIAMNDEVFQIPAHNAKPISMNVKARAIAVYGSQLHFVGTDGRYYLRVQNKDIQIF